MEKDIIVFDGVCVLCNSFYKWVLKNDKENKFNFSNIQSKYYTENKKIDKSIDSILVVNNKTVLYESDAVNYILRKLNKLLIIRLFIIVTPKLISNFFYRIIAKNRYKVFGKKKECFVPSGEELRKFIKWTLFDTFI